MLVQLEHPSVHRCLVWQDLLDGCCTLGQFCGRIESFARKVSQVPVLNNPFFLEYEEDEKKTPEQFANRRIKGDIFEIFTEMIIRLSPIDDRIGIADYHVVTDGDTGVDGWGIGPDGEVVTVQVKYRLWDYELTYIHERLDNLRATSYGKFKIDPAEIGRMLVVTTGKDIHWKTLEHFGGKVRCISNNASYRCLKGSPIKTVDSLFSLRTIVNNNVVFWDAFRKATLHA